MVESVKVFFINSGFETLFLTAVILIPVFIVVNILWILGRKTRKARNKSIRMADMGIVNNVSTKNFFQKIGRSIKLFLSRNPNFWTNVAFMVVETFFIGTIAGSIFYMFFTKPQILASTPEYEGYWEDQENPVEIIFSVPIKVDELKFNISPEIEGRWEYIESFPNIPALNFVRKLKFYPTETLAPETRVVIYITGISRLTKNENHEYARNFFSAHTPTVTTTSPENNSEKIQINSEIVFTVENLNEKTTTWEVVTEPSFEHTVNIANGKITVTPENPLNQDTEYTITLYKTIRRYTIETGETVETFETITESIITFKTVPTPGVLDYSPKGESARVDIPVTVEFDGDVNEAEVEERFSLNPSVAGQLSWEGNTLIFTPVEALPYDTSFTILIAKGFHNGDGGVSESDIELAFTTVGEVKLLQTSPIANSAGVKVTVGAVSVTFNQEVEQASAEANFSIYPNAPGTFTWQANTLTYTFSGNLAYSTTYTVTVKSGVKAVYGLDLSQSNAFSFTTASDRTIIEGVPWYKQTEHFTCNVQATNMVLGYHGIYLGEQGVKNALGIGQWLDEAAGTGGNPHDDWIEFFGVFWEPVYNLVSQYRPAEIKQGWTIQGLTAATEQGALSILWWHNDWSPFYWKTWTTPDGETITGLNGTHSEVVVGFIGPAENPTHIITNDPWRGAGRVYDIATFTRLWSVYNNTAVVVY